MLHVDYVLAAAALGLYLWMTYIPGSKPWIVTVKMVVAAVTTALVLLWTVIVCGLAASDGPVFPRHVATDEPAPLHERRY